MSMMVAPNINNGLQLPEVGVLEHSTVYNHKCKFNELMFIYAPPRQFWVGAVIGRAVLLLFVLRLPRICTCLSTELY
jgi:hypothetical protein